MGGFALWVPSLVTSGILALLGLAGGYFLKAVIEKGVEHGFNRELEVLKADLRTKDAQFESLKSAALSALASRSTALDQRRLQAVEALWAATLAQGKLKMAAGFVSMMKIDAMLKASAQQSQEGEKIRILAKLLLQSSGLGHLVPQTGGTAAAPVEALPDSDRLFSPPLAWAAFTAFRAVTSHAAIVLVTMASGLGPELLKENTDIRDMVKAALPEYSNFIETYKETGIYHLLEQLQEKIFSELISSFHDTSISRNVIDQAACILRYAEKPNMLDLPADLPDKFKAEKISVPQNAD